MNKKGSYIFLLHFHLPFVWGHERWPFGEEWLFEAVLGSYLPLSRSLKRLSDKGVAPNIALSFTPVLLEQLIKPEFKNSFCDYLKERIRLYKTDEENASENNIKELSRFYQERINGLQEYYLKDLKGEILRDFQLLAQNGQIELMTSSATHAFLPLLSQEDSVRMQIKIAKKVFTRIFGFEPAGFWLPECGFRGKKQLGNKLSPSLDKILEDYGFKFTFLETHALGGEYFDGKNSLPTGENFYSPEECLQAYKFLDSKVYFFLRHPRFSYQVWSGDWGYPGDFYYREFHKRKATSGAQYWRVTDAKGDLGTKEFYQPEVAKERVFSHVDHFAAIIDKALALYNSQTGKEGVIVTPFDAELFGHWWYEGVDWLENLLEKLSVSEKIKVKTPSDYLRENHFWKLGNPIYSSWGYGGGDEVWKNEETNWMWKKIYEAEDNFFHGYQDKDRINFQLKRELLLLQASDWEFLITTKQAYDYAVRRFSAHDRNFNLLLKLGDKILTSQEELILKEIEEKDKIFLDEDLS